MPDILNFGKPPGNDVGPLHRPVGGYRDHHGVPMDTHSLGENGTTGILEAMRTQDVPNTMLGKTIIGGVVAVFIIYAIFY